MAKGENEAKKKRESKRTINVKCNKKETIIFVQKKK